MECFVSGNLPSVNATQVVKSNAVCRMSNNENYIVKRSKADIAKLMAVKDKVGMAAAVAASVVILGGVPSADAFTREEFQQLSYEQVKGSGLANRCPEVESSKGAIKIEKGKKYKIVDLCLEPKSFQVEEEKTTRKGDVTKVFIDTKLMTRATYTLTGIEGPLEVNGAGDMIFSEKEGIDYAATTLQMPGGERVPFLFTIKELVATAKGDVIKPGVEFGGEFTVPSYRTGLFLDPKGRGGVTGYDMAVALPGLEADGAEGQSELFKESNKVFQVSKGEIELGVSKVDAVNNEIAGVFVSEQLGDTDMGAKVPKNVLLKGVFFARIQAE
mmetsp:Transcript_18821/g.32637  ORF Transcript_18821/g.32637 Transcript_18821/m.32637 type:complete len:328 (+) Transcript_18821:163-1146(+)|eukprot:CAMPEP_0184691840 /NCGR_PEP_ID=MMETSP0313-20130426/559_1 /TAXON_ID=2792 /ORGANISM="Porphyridium aerugineum, Strain SAG 1380-2" /LENGTH=327 /DNA_ID=CAMNT_0027149605 /DNA_START=113 /DNA_END=1096 /DNA_ORIENTATION=+